MANKRDNTTKRGKQTTKTKTTQNRNTQPRTARRKNTKKKSRSHRKKTSLRIKRLIALLSLILIIFAVIFIGKKTIGFVSDIWPNIISVKNSMTGGAIDKTDVNSDEQYDISDEKEVALEKKHNIFIDVGCGGYENGYIADDIKEKDLNLKIAKQVVKKLSKYDDVNVILSRKEDVYMSSDERKSLAESQNAELFVSIHMASEKTGEASGVETLYHINAKDGSSDFASLMQTSIMAFIKAENRGTNSYDMSVLKDNGMPSIYIQCGFLSNSSEKKNLNDEEYQDQLAEGIAQGILSYIDAKK